MESSNFGPNVAKIMYKIEKEQNLTSEEIILREKSEWNGIRRKEK